MRSLSNDQTPATPNNSGLTYGNTADNLILPHENPADFESLLEGLLAEYQPETAQHRIFVEQVAIGHWHLWRRERAFNALETLIYERDPDPIRWVDNDFHRLALAERYKISAERSLKRALQNAESIRKERKAHQTGLEHRARWQAEQSVRERRLNLQEEKQKAAAEKTSARAAVAEPAYKSPIQWPEGPVGVPVPEHHSAGVIADQKSRPDQE